MSIRAGSPGQHGFTLVEVILVIVLLSIVAVLGSRMLGTGFSAFFTGRDITDANWQGRYAMERIGRDLRVARSATAADLTMLPATAITLTDLGGNVITYALNGTILERNGIPLADGVSVLGFSYIQADGKTTAV